MKSDMVCGCRSPLRDNVRFKLGSTDYTKLTIPSVYSDVFWLLYGLLLLNILTLRGDPMDLSLVKIHKKDADGQLFYLADIIRADRQVCPLRRTGAPPLWVAVYLYKNEIFF